MDVNRLLQGGTLARTAMASPGQCRTFSRLFFGGLRDNGEYSPSWLAHCRKSGTRHRNRRPAPAAPSRHAPREGPAVVKSFGVEQDEIRRTIARPHCLRKDRHGRADAGRRGDIPWAATVSSTQSRTSRALGALRHRTRPESPGGSSCLPALRHDLPDATRDQGHQARDRGASGGPHGADGPSHGRVFECLKGDGVPEGKQPLQSSLHEEPTDQPSDRPERQLVLDRVFED